MTAGKTLSHYQILERIGEGGMGAVYRALDTHLDRTVAIKVLRPEAIGDPERTWRFVREAKAASALNHPNIVTIYDIDTADGVQFIAMERVEGSGLDRVIAQGRLSLEEALGYGVQIAGALAAAHAAGIVHRDIKPANVMITTSGQVKVLDFGLAKLLEPAGSGAAASSADSLAGTMTAPTDVPGTARGTVLGTLAYMSPEQAEGKPVDARSDVFSLGCVLYEMLAGRRPFEGDSRLSTLAAILRDPPKPLESIRPDVPPDVERVLQRALEKKPENRYVTATALHQELSACQARLSARPVASAFRRPAVLLPLLGILLAAAAAGAWLWRQGSRARWARDVALPEIARLTKTDQPAAALSLARQAERYAPAEVERFRRDSWPNLVSIRTVPPGATISIRDYLAPGSAWQQVGDSPIADLRLPQGYYRWLIAKAGFQPIEVAGTSIALPTFQLDPPASVPPGMVHVPGGTFQFRSVADVDLPDYWLDKYEVTNRQFKEFVSHGGYEKREYWKEPFAKDGGRVLSWEEARAEFRDSTGRPGPSTWALGTYPDGHEDYPVDGVSWYEAAAYAEFAGKSLPTIYHWYNAAGTAGVAGNFSEILRLSNFDGKGTARVGSYQGIAPYGSYDMAGNVREWCWNETGGKRFILGGAWNDLAYFFAEPNAQPPFDRSAANGFRCIRSAAPPSEALLRPIAAVSRDFSKERPVPDDVFRIYRSFFAYDRTPLEAKTESVDETSPYWRKQKVSYRAAYGDERVPAYLFLPRNASPPYQTIVYFPSGRARLTRSSENLDFRVIDFVIRSGRALLYPIYKETYERMNPEASQGPNFRRDMVVAWSKDLGRSLDYLETRPDIERGKLAYYGTSMGTNDGVILLAIEERFQAAVLLAGGFRFGRYPPEIDMINFAPRVKLPVLLLGGSQDFQHPVETAQKPLFRMLGTAEKDKRYFSFEGGHTPLKMEPIIKEILDWLDRYLGPVKTKA